MTNVFSTPVKFEDLKVGDDIIFVIQKGEMKGGTYRCTVNSMYKTTGHAMFPGGWRITFVKEDKFWRVKKG